MTAQEKTPRLAAVKTPGRAERPPDEAEALARDLAALEERLEDLVAQLRDAPAPADPAVRGLLIEEADVAGWLADLPAARADAESPRGGGAGRPGTPGGRLARLSALFGLSPLDTAIVLTALAPEIDLTYANLYAYVQDDVTRKHATLDLALRLWSPGPPNHRAAREALAAGGPLRRNQLILIDDAAGAAPLLARPLLLDPRTAAYLLGADTVGTALAGATRVVHPRAEPIADALAPLSREAQDRLAAMASSAIGADPPRPFAGWLHGPESQGKRAVVEQVASRLGRSLLVVDCAVLEGADGPGVAGQVLREARLRDAILYWVHADALAARREDSTPQFGPELQRLLEEAPVCSFFDLGVVPAPVLATGMLTVLLDFPTPAPARRRLLWTQALAGDPPLGPDVDMELLSGAFRLTGDQIAAAAESARQQAVWHGAGGPITMHDLATAARTHSSHNLGMLARKVIPRYTWADLVLPTDRLAQLHEMCNAVRFGPVVFEQWGFDRKLSAGKGVNVLFAGQPGTGKTMAAEVLATDLGLDLYKIDLSSMVSKYIGETEKNLEKVFHEGGTSNAILFFDEADSIFGKRSEVKDSHDRYANIEISYLLQRMEEYDGIVILATNLRKNLDEAFIRRLRGAIEFPMPEEPDRLEIWRRTFPPEAPLDPAADLAFLAHRFKLSGGNIKNIVLDAAFLAAEAGTAIRMVHLVRATRREHQKMGRLIAPGDFGPYAPLFRPEPAGA